MLMLLTILILLTFIVVLSITNVSAQAEAISVEHYEELIARQKFK